MKRSEKITAQRKAHGLSQEELADRLGVSRQAVSRWEQGSALPDANNLVQLSRTFGVTTDYLLHDDYENDQDLPPVRENQETHFRQLFAILVMLEVMVLIIQFLAVFVLQSVFFGILSFLPMVAVAALNIPGRKIPGPRRRYGGSGCAFIRLQPGWGSISRCGCSWRNWLSTIPGPISPLCLRQSRWLST